MIRAATLVAAAATGVVALATAPVASAVEMTDPAGARASILFGSLTPVQVDVVAGEAVDWTNDSVRDHTVTADDGSYDSGTIGPNEHYRRLFDRPGAYPYHCRLHPYIRGEVDVHTLLLDKPAQPGAPGRPYPLTGRAALPAGTPVAIEFDDGSGAWRPVAEAEVAADGGFSATLAPSASGSYRASAAGEQSPAVPLLVLNRSLTATVRRVRGSSRISVAASPASPQATVVLEVYLKDRFGWWPIGRGRLGSDSRTTFSLRNRRPVSARVLLTLPDGATVIAASSKVRLRTS